MTTTDLPEIMAVSTKYANSHLGELAAFVRQGGYVRIMDLRRGGDLWLRPDAPAGVVPDSTLHRAMREQAQRMTREATGLWLLPSVRSTG
jgi:hypothetical protein